MDPFLALILIFAIIIVGSWIGTFTVPRMKVPEEAGKTPLYQTQWASVKGWKYAGRSVFGRVSVYPSLAVVKTLFSTRILTPENLISFEENTMPLALSFNIRYRTPYGSESSFYLGVWDKAAVVSAMRQAGLVV